MVSVYHEENSNEIFKLTTERIKNLVEESVNGEVETEYIGFNDKIMIRIKPSAIPNVEFNYLVYNISKKILLNTDEWPKFYEDMARVILRSYDKWIHSLIFKKGAKYGYRSLPASTECPEEDA